MRCPYQGHCHADDCRRTGQCALQRTERLHTSYACAYGHCTAKASRYLELPSGREWVCEPHATQLLAVWGLA